ncbi:class IV adenylate cyclase [Candidatus Hodarchaeum mangrovi]
MEVEIKIPLNTQNSQNQIIKNLIKKLGKPISQVIQKDCYFQSPIENFWDTDRALRIRDTIFPSKTILSELTYKGPKQGDSLKIREELNVKIRNSKTAYLILERLGFYHFKTIKKSRISWKYDLMTISFDVVENLGQFLEIELLQAKKSMDIEFIKKKIISMVKDLIPDWDGKEERKSYLELLILKEKFKE